MAKAKDATDRVVQIPEIRLERILVTIEGTTPLLTDKLSEEALEKIENKQTGAARGPRPPRDPEAEFRGKLYTLSEGVYGFPASGLKKALVAAGGRFGDEQMTRLRGVLTIQCELVEIRGSEPVMHTAVGRLQGKVASPIYRPMFWPWKMEIPFTFNRDLITADQLVNLVQLAGFAVGIGAWRPEKSGTFGQFRLATGD